MAKNKIERIDQEITKVREKIAEYQEKLKALEAQKTEAENLEIVQMVRALRMTPAQLNAMLSGGMNHGRDTALSESNNQEVIWKPMTVRSVWTCVPMPDRGLMLSPLSMRGLLSGRWKSVVSRRISAT